MHKGNYSMRHTCRDSSFITWLTTACRGHGQGWFPMCTVGFEKLFCSLDLALVSWNGWLSLSNLGRATAAEPAATKRLSGSFQGFTKSYECSNYAINRRVLGEYNSEPRNQTPEALLLKSERRSQWSKHHYCRYPLTLAGTKVSSWKHTKQQKASW